MRLLVRFVVWLWRSDDIFPRLVFLLPIAQQAGSIVESVHHLGAQLANV